MHTFAQIGINTDSPDVSSALDIDAPGKDRGLHIPEMTTIQKNAITNPAHSLLVYDKDLKCISQNMGTESAPDWKCLTLFNTQFFYMPSINIETSVLGTAQVDLYGIYRNQFSSPMKSSLGAQPAVPTFSSGDLYYYITYYDNNIMSIDDINNQGMMNYTIKKKANLDTYINIVFVVK